MVSFESFFFLFHLLLCLFLVDHFLFSVILTFENCAFDTWFQSFFFWCSGVERYIWTLQILVLVHKLLVVFWYCSVILFFHVNLNCISISESAYVPGWNLGWLYFRNWQLWFRFQMSSLSTNKSSQFFLFYSTPSGTYVLLNKVFEKYLDNWFIIWLFPKSLMPIHASDLLWRFPEHKWCLLLVLCSDAILVCCYWVSISPHILRKI